MGRLLVVVPGGLVVVVVDVVVVGMVVGLVVQFCRDVLLCCDDLSRFLKLFLLLGKRLP